MDKPDEILAKINRIERRLCDSLYELCQSLGIPIKYLNKLDNDDGGELWYNHYKDSGEYDVSNASINISNKYKDNPSYLAHELGHYMAIKKHGDVSEEAADKEGLALCKLILNKEEQKMMGIILNWYFKKGMEDIFDENNVDTEELTKFIIVLQKKAGKVVV